MFNLTNETDYKILSETKNYFKDNRIKKSKNFQNNKNWGFEILTKKPLTPSKTEVLENNRARSAKLRVGRFIN